MSGRHSTGRYWSENAELFSNFYGPLWSRSALLSQANAIVIILSADSKELAFDKDKCDPREDMEGVQCERQLHGELCAAPWQRRQ